MRRRAAAALLAALAAPAVAQPVAAPPAPAAAQAGAPLDLAQALERMRRKVAAGIPGLVRADGHIYAVDVGQAMTEFARAGERAAYATLRELAVSAFIQTDRQNPYIDGFVAWRIRPGEPPDASGTAEALRIAEGLLAGAEAFGGGTDAKLAHQVLLGYQRHGYRDHGVWLVRNYFNFGTRAFSPNSYIVNYDLDLVARWRAPEGAALAGEVRALIERAARPNGLLNEIIQPEVVTAVPLPELVTFSPDGVHSIVNSCMVLERAAAALPERGRRFLDTVVRAVESAGPKRAAEFFVPPYLDGRSGMPISRDYPADIFVQGCLARLARVLGHSRAASFRLSYLAQLDAAWGDGSQYDLLYLSEVVHSLRVLGER